MHKIIDNKWIKGNITTLVDGEIFVYGSNESSIHGAGAAKLALNWGAIYGKKPYGLCGQTFGIPTKDQRVQTLELEDIKQYVGGFVEEAEFYHKLTFLVTAVGCGLAGYKNEEIAPMFRKCVDLDNVYLPIEWREILEGE